MNTIQKADERRRALEMRRSELEIRIASTERDERSDTTNGQTDTAHEWENAEIRDGENQEAMNELREIEAAMRRLDRGTYGVCSRCGAQIAAGRLDVLPATDLCVACAE